MSDLVRLACINLLCLLIPLILVVNIGIKLRGTYSETWGRYAWGCLLACLLIFVCPYLFLAMPFTYNNYGLVKLAHPFYSYPLPPQTTEIDQQAYAGTLPGQNGSVCSFLIERILHTDLSQREIEAYYANVLFDPVEFKSFASSFREDNKLTPDIQWDTPELGLVTVSLYDGGYVDGIRINDPRCWL